MHTNPRDTALIRIAEQAIAEIDALLNAHGPTDSLPLYVRLIQTTERYHTKRILLDIGET